MVNKLLTLRSSVAGNRPPAGHSPGELYVNFADNQIGVVNASSANQDLLAVRRFLTSANYAIGDFVLQGGNIYQATAASAAGAFNPANWTQVATLAGGTYTGTITAPYFVLNAAAGQNRSVNYDTAGVVRWGLLVDGSAESGSNAGSNFAISRWSDSGAYIDEPISIQRANGFVSFADGLAVNGGNLIVQGGSYAEINGAAGSNRLLYFMTGGQSRWSIYADSETESGSNAGSNFLISRYTDAGAYIDNPINVNRASGLVTFVDNISFNTAAGVNRGAYFETNGVIRWLLAADSSAESGGNAGTNFVLGRYSDTGAYIDEPLTIQRNTGVVGLNDGATTVTPAVGDASNNIATTNFVVQHGAQCSGQQSVNGATTLTAVNGGGSIILTGSPGYTVTFPSLAATFWLSNLTSGDINLSFPVGTDFRNVIHTHERVILCGDGGGFYRVFSYTSGSIPA